MPVIAPPPDTFVGNPEDYYQQLGMQIAIATSGVGGAFLDISMTGAASASPPPDPTLFAMTGGFLRFYPPGTSIPSPDAFIEPQQGVLVLTTWLGDVEAQAKAFPATTPPIGRVYYVGVDAVATGGILRVETAKMSEKALRASWKSATGSAPPAATTLTDLIDAHNARVMGATGSLFVEGGTPIGAVAFDASLNAYRLTLRMTSNDASSGYVSPAPVFMGAPYYEL